MTEIRKPICVVAGTLQQYRDWLRESGVTSREAVYCPTPEHVRGMEFSRIEHVGTWYANKNALAASIEASSRVR